MALNLGRLFYKLDVSTKAIDTAAFRSKSFVREIEKDNNRMSKSVNRLTKSYRLLGVAISAAFLGVAAKRIFDLSDAYQAMSRRLAVATDSTRELKEISQELFDISQRTRVSFSSNIPLFVKLERMGPSLRATNDEILEVVESLNKLVFISGSTEQQSRNAMLQLGQAVSSGIVRAEEYNSIMENTPAIIISLLRGMGMADSQVGQLRNMIIKQQMTSKMFFEAIQKDIEQTKKDFAKLDPVVQDSTIVLKDSFARLIGETDAALGITKGIAAMMIKLAGDIQTDVSPAVLFLKELWIKTQTAMGSVIKVFTELSDAFKQATGESISFRKIFMTISTVANLSILAVSTAVRTAINQIQVMFNNIQIGWEKFKNFFGQGDSQLVLSLEKENEVLRKNGDLILQDAANRADKIVNADIYAQKELEIERLKQEKLDELAQKEADRLAKLKQEHEAYLEKQKALAEEQTKREASYAAFNLNLKENDFKALEELDKKQKKKRFEREDKALAQQLQMAGEHNRAFFELSKAIALANSALDGARAVSAAYRHGVELGGPALGITFASIAAAAAAINTAQIASSQYQKKRIGGRVQKGSIYEVGEGGGEFFKSGQRNYFLPGRDGRIIPNHQTGGNVMPSSPKVSINIFNNSSNEVEVGQPSENSDGSFDIDVFVNRVKTEVARDIYKGDGEVSEAIQTTFGGSRVSGL